MIERVQDWLTKDALPLWLKNGVDWKNGGFFESLSLDGEPQDVPRRAMVQARQIYSFKVAKDLKLCDADQASRAIELGVRSLINDFSHKSGGFIHSIGIDRQPVNSTLELYTQAFAIFGLAHAYAQTAQPEFKSRAKDVIQYLSRERRVNGGGFTEVKTGTTYESNPHMHLFEAALEWMEIDTDPEWKLLADEILDLALSKFIDPATGALAEFFSDSWLPLLENGKFVFEPGHQFEWAWLMGRHQKITGRNLLAVRTRLFELAERSGVDAKTKMTLDQMWSDFSVKSHTSRFWPQAERVKAAVQLTLEDTSRETAAVHAKSADDALTALFDFLNTPTRGLWFDTREADGTFKRQPAKASSLYHIIGAMSEYLRLPSRVRR